MQNEPSATTGSTNTMSSSPFKSELHQKDAVYASLYSPMYSDSLFSDSTSNMVSNHLYHSRSVQEHQEIVNRHSLCLTHLREATGEAENLRLENKHLRAVNRELNKHLSLLIHASLRSTSSSSSLPSSSNDFTTAPSFAGALDDAFRRLSLGGGMDEGSDQGSPYPWDDVAASDLESPTSVIESGRNQNAEVERFSLPKSISVRSNGYLKNPTHQPAAPTRTRTATKPPPATTPLNVTQKVYVRGVKKEQEPLELEVYNQGMFKTELCNKWQETGACPYGDHCQFAHGVEELRPVLRHPRYKTEVCRMVLTGIACPYGHRCHFRHALTEQERAMGPLMPRAIKLDR